MKPAAPLEGDEDGRNGPISPTRTWADGVRLAGEELQGERHACLLVDRPGEACDVLVPFMVEGLERGERAFHIVDPEARDAHLERLRAAGIDVSAALQSRQLEVRTWADAYLRGGTFNPAAQLAYVRQSLGEGPALGYPVTRLIGSLEWAFDGADVMGDVLDYETRLDELLRRRSDIVVCTYDLNRHSPRTIAEVLGLHPAVVVGGVLRMGRGRARAAARDRLLGAAAQLFHETGIQATGVDSLIQAAGVAKATFYRHFPSKDDLVIAWLRDPQTRWFDQVRTRAEAHGAEPLDLIPLFFEALAVWLEAEDFRGCPYLNSAAEIRDPMHPARGVIRDYLQEIQDYLGRLAAAAGYRDPQLLAAELHVLVAGAISLAVAHRSTASAVAAREAALALLRAAARD